MSPSRTADINNEQLFGRTQTRGLGQETMKKNEEEEEEEHKRKNRYY